MLKLYQEKTIIKNHADPSKLDIDFEKGIILGKFIDLDRPTFIEHYDKIYRPSRLQENVSGLNS